MGTNMGTKETKSQLLGNIYDTFVKRMFGRILVFIDFLLHYADKRFVDEIDIDKIAPAPTHYMGGEGDERIADLIFQCPLKDGNGSLMAVIVFEHQSTSLKKIPLKLHKIISAFWTAEAKEGKNLSTPYFIVLRTGKKPYRGQYPKMSDLLPKGRDGKPLGHVPEIWYDVFDLPAWNFGELMGGPILRAALGILKKMIEEAGEDFPEALRPLLELSDKDQKVEVTQEILDFVDKALRVRHRRLDKAGVSEVLKTVFEDQKMIKSIFDEEFDAGVAVGEARGKAIGEVRGEAKMLLKILRARFHQVPKNVEKLVQSMTDAVALDSWAQHAATCQSMAEFTKAIR